MIAPALSGLAAAIPPRSIARCGRAAETSAIYEALSLAMTSNNKACPPIVVHDETVSGFGEGWSCTSMFISLHARQRAKPMLRDALSLTPRGSGTWRWQRNMQGGRSNSNTEPTPADHPRRRAQLQ
jgi:hypothetical protein